MNSQEAFETHCKDLNLDRHADGYADVTTDMLWCTWKAATKWQQDKDKQEDDFWEAMNAKPLRDEFAKAAMQGMLAGGSYASYNCLIEDAYEIADAMLKEREK